MNISPDHSAAGGDGANAFNSKADIIHFRDGDHIAVNRFHISYMTVITVLGGNHNRSHRRRVVNPVAVRPRVGEPVFGVAAPRNISFSRHIPSAVAPRKTMPAPAGGGNITIFGR